MTKKRWGFVVLVCAAVIVGFAGLRLYQRQGTDIETTDASLLPAQYALVPGLTASYQLPDTAVNGILGKGFTCTGFAWDAQEGCWWAGNAGKLQTSDPVWYPTLIKLSADFSEKLDELYLYEIYPSMNTETVGVVQGVCVDTGDSSLWIASAQEGMVRHITKGGQDLGSFAFERANGIAYDSRTDTLWILSQTQLVNADKTGSILQSIPVAITGQDMLWLDELSNTMYFTAGANYSGTNYVCAVDLDSGLVDVRYILPDSYCVEGIHISGNIMYIMNDGYYHDGTIPVNLVNVYSIASQIN